MWINLLTGRWGKWLAIMLAALALSLMIKSLHADGYRKGAAATEAAWQSKWDRQLASHAQALADASERQRQIEHRYQEQLESIQHDGQLRLDAALADAAAAADESDRLQRTARELARRAGRQCPAATTAASGQTTQPAAVLLADVLGRADQRAGELAALADRAIAAGIACQRAYDAVRSQP